MIEAFNRHRLLYALLLGVLLVVIIIDVFINTQKQSSVMTYAVCVQAGNPIVETNPPTCTADGVQYIGPRSTTVQGATIINRQFDILVNGDLGSAHPRLAEVVNSQIEWSTYWRRIHSKLASIPPILQVDFSKHTVLAISEGAELTTGYVYKITQVSSDTQGNKTVEVTESIPSIGCKVQNVTSNRYYIVSTEKLTGPVAFNTTVDHRRCN